MANAEPCSFIVKMVQPARHEFPATGRGTSISDNESQGAHDGAILELKPGQEVTDVFSGSLWPQSLPEVPDHASVSEEPALLTHTREVAHKQLGWGKFLDVQFAILGSIQAFELRLHKLHSFLLGDLAVFFGADKEQQLLDLVRAECQFNPAALEPRPWVVQV